ncbi:MAG TPA: SDR family oxidoreductase [Baekduia sp.]|uniref:SDR family NAD(P)-dependent oxidoreductase n=1 Tax=Baekduia sp. TaxID=2600305 RepID=UPI002C1FECAE|nr:SDR family oxidoreductase [Baekduia sp.]HMJ36696.1 SDR family oxidoreductase [Baekduia sp.]
MLAGKVALITGGARGIGRATAEILSEQGAQVVVADLDADAAHEAAQQLPGEAAVWAGDVTADGAADALVAATVGAFGRIDIVVNNAGYTVDAPVHKMTDADFQAMLDIHTIAPFRILRAAAPHLREPARAERAEGREVFRKVVNVASLAAFGNPGQSNYAAAKSGVLGLTKTLAKEWGGFRVNVNAVAFGFVETRLTQPKTETSVIDVGGRAIAVGVPEQVRSALGGLVPLGRAATPREAAGGIAFLCSPWSDYVTGQVLNVTGGLPFAMGPA